MSIADLTRQLREFSAERDWEQFNTPKNLVMALVSEVGELTELFQWLTPAQAALIMKDEASASQVRDEMADVLAYLLRLSDVLGVDLEAALAAKMLKNADKYPIAPSLARAARLAKSDGGDGGGGH
jgi:dCTP diphosphatase